jgi:N-acetylglucosaminyldiphosphoundecaprenol N-acetyl-beta-D-mannosaminyltransferase
MMIALKPKFLHGVKIYPVGLDDALKVAVQYIPNKDGDYFCFVNVHLLMESQKDEKLIEILNKSAGNFPDGMGVAWALKLFGYKFKVRVRGADFMLRLCEYAERNGLKIFLYCSS